MARIGGATRVGAFWRRYRLPLLGGLVLVLAFVLPSFFPQWYVSVTEFLWANLLFTGLLCLALLGLLLWKLPQWQVADVQSVHDRVDLEVKSRQTLAHICGGAVLLIGLYYTVQTLSTPQATLQIAQETLRLAQQGQMTERIARAIEHLGDKERLTVRLGGIYALEQLARDSAPDYWQIMEVLTAYVRDNAPWPSQDAQPLQDAQGLQEKQRQENKRPLGVPPRFSLTPGTDIQSVLTVLGRRTRTYGKGESQRLNLLGTALQGARLEGAHLEGSDLADTHLQSAYLQGAHLEGAHLEGSDLAGAYLQGAYLQGAYLKGAHLKGAFLEAAFLGAADLAGAVLQGADLTGAHLPRAHLTGAHLAGAHLWNTELWGADLRGADLRGAKDLTQQQTNMICVDERTQLPEGLTQPPPCRVTQP